MKQWINKKDRKILKEDKKFIRYCKSVSLRTDSKDVQDEYLLRSVRYKEFGITREVSCRFL